LDDFFGVVGCYLKGIWDGKKWSIFSPNLTVRRIEVMFGGHIEMLQKIKGNPLEFPKQINPRYNNRSMAKKNC
jgi:hypothetical protein